MEGLLKGCGSIVEETEGGTATRDAAVIMAAQKVEHYEIGSYGGLVTFAKALGSADAANVLAETLEEEKNADTGLTEIAENAINWEAAEEHA